MLDFQHGDCDTLTPKTYNANALKAIRTTCQHDHRLKVLPFGAIRRIKELKLNRKRRRGRKIKQNIRIPFIQNGCNLNNIITIKKQGHKPENKIIFGTCNIQSVRLKELQVSDLVNDYSLDFLLLTETWLSDKHNQWKDCTTLNKDGLSLSTSDRVGRKGGGLALIHKTAYKTKLLNKGTKPTFKHASWELRIKNVNLIIHSIYHPPPSLANKMTNDMFIEEFIEFVSTTLPSHPNNIYIGDFNLHVSEEDMDPAIFNDSIEAMGLYQHVGFPTHKSGNILDLILSDIQQTVSVMTTAPGLYLSDHRAVIATLNSKRLNPTFSYKQVCRLKDITQEQLTKEFRPENVPLSSKLEEIVLKLNNELTCTLNTLAPLKTQKINLRPKKPWYDMEMKTHKRQMRKMEKKWLKHKSEPYWVAYKKCRNSYYGKLNFKKKVTLRHKLVECNKDSKKIHTLINNLTTKQQTQQWPPHKSEEDLVEDFAKFFLEKITKIREALRDKPVYTPTSNDPPKLQGFTSLKDEDVLKVIMSLRTKSCKLDPIPTATFKIYSQQSYLL